MPQVGFKPTTLVSERAKTVHPLYRAATLIGFHIVTIHYSLNVLTFRATSDKYTNNPRCFVTSISEEVRGQTREDVGRRCVF
jgi:hypothetical protein